MLGSWACATAACRVPGLVPRQPGLGAAFFLRSALPTGLAMAASVYLGNLSYLYLSVAFVQMLKALTPGERRRFFIVSSSRCLCV